MEHNNNHEQMTVLALKNLARERGITGYSRLRKSELIKTLREPILNQDINARMANVPFLTPTPYVSPANNSSTSTITLFKRCWRFNRLEQRKRNTEKRFS